MLDNPIKTDDMLYKYSTNSINQCFPQMELV